MPTSSSLQLSSSYTDFIKAVDYSDWISNIIPVPKKDGKVRMCVDYRYLNSPKDSFPIPHIDVLVDNTAGNGSHSWTLSQDTIRC